VAPPFFCVRTSIGRGLPVREAKRGGRRAKRGGAVQNGGGRHAAKGSGNLPKKAALECYGQKHMVTPHIALQSHKPDV
jgi:hypothetical protein